MPQILDGKATAAAIKSELTERVEALKARGITPVWERYSWGMIPPHTPMWALNTATARRLALIRSV